MTKERVIPTCRRKAEIPSPEPLEYNEVSAAGGQGPQ